MNIIELFERSAIYRANLTEFSTEDSLKVRKQSEIEQSQNPNFNNATQQDLLLAMNDFPKELLFIANNRILYNFFANTNYSRTRFTADNAVLVTPEAVKLFIHKFLKPDVEAFFEAKVNQNKFDEIDDFLAVKEYLPQEILDLLSEKLISKLDGVVEALEKNPEASQTLAFNFIKHRSFYDLLSHFRSATIDASIEKLLNLMTSTLVGFSVKNEFLNPMMMSMGNYKAVNPDLASTLKFNKEQTMANTQKTSSGSSVMSTGSIIVVIIIVIRLILLMVRCSKM